MVKMGKPSRLGIVDVCSRALVLVLMGASALVGAAADGDPLSEGRGASASLGVSGQRENTINDATNKTENAFAQQASPRRLQAGNEIDERALLLAFKASGNGAGLGSWAAGSEPCGAGYGSVVDDEGWRGLRCDAAGGSVERICLGSDCVSSTPSLTADIGALAGLSLTSLNVYGTAVSGDLAALAGMPLTFLNVYNTPVSGDVAALAGMPLERLYTQNSLVSGDLATLAELPLTFLTVSGTAVSGDVATLAGMPLTGLYVQDSLVFGDTAALSATGTFSFTPCSDLGGCGSGTLVASPATYAGRTQAACCGTMTCVGNPPEEGWLQSPDRFCPTSRRIASFPTEAEARAACLADASCRAVFDDGCDGSGDFWTCSSVGSPASGYCMYDHGRQQPDYRCRAGSLISAANTTAGYDHATCCDGTCAGNADSPDYLCPAGAHLKAEAPETNEYSYSECCDECPDGEWSPSGSTAADNCTDAACGAGEWGLGTPDSPCLICPTPTRCLGGERCSEGSDGPACAYCSLRPVRHYALNSECVKCPDEGGWIIIALSAVAMIAFLYALHVITGVDNLSADENATKAIGSLFAIGIGHLQMSVHIFSLPSIPWPFWVRQLMEYLRNVAFFSFADFSRPECQEAAPSNPAEMFLLKFALSQALFLVLFSFFIAQYLFARFLLHGAAVNPHDGLAEAQRARGKTLKNHAINSMIALFSICFLLLVKTSASMFACTDGQLDEYPDIKCWDTVGDPVHLVIAGFATISLVVYVVVFPGLLYCKLRSAKKKGTLVDPENKAKFGWVFLRYKYHCCEYYEYLTMARKGLVVLVGVFFSGSDWATLILTALVLCAALALHIYLNPYTDHEINHDDEDSHDRDRRTEDDNLDTLGMVCEIMPLAVAMYFVAVPDEPENVGDNLLYYAISAVALIVAVTPLVVGLWITVKAHMEERASNKDAAEPSESFDNAAHEDADETGDEEAKD